MVAGNRGSNEFLSGHDAVKPHVVFCQFIGKSILSNKSAGGFNRDR